MKDFEKIEELLEKYYEGATSTEEEQLLRRFFEREDIPEKLEADAGLFRFFRTEKEGKSPPTLEEDLTGMIPGSIPLRPAAGQKLKYYWISGAAAVVLILLGLFLDTQIRRNSSLEVRQDTFEDPYLAYEEARKALYIVSMKMNTPREPLKNLNKLESGVNYMSPVFSFGAGVRHLEHFNRIEETRKRISKETQ
jgi:hypothetical protein